MARSDCPAFGKICANCKIPNHFSDVCEDRKYKVSFIRNGDETSDSEFNSDYEDNQYTDQSSGNESLENSCNAAAELQDFRLAKKGRSQP